MANSLTELFTSLLALPDLDRNAIAALLYPDSKSPLQTTSLRMRPGTRQLVDKLSHRLGISQSDFLNLIVEGSLREIFLPFSTSATSIIDRFEVLMLAHDLSPTEITQLLSPWNIRLSVLQDRERTMDYLTTPLLEKLANWFYVSPAWLLGNDVPPVDMNNLQWPDNEEAFHQLIIPSVQNRNCEIIFWTNENTSIPQYKNRNGILVRIKESASGVVYYPVISVVETRSNNKQQHLIEQVKKEYGRTCPMRSVTISNSVASALEQGITLPALIFKQL